MIATEVKDPFGPTLQLLNQAITTQQQELLQAAPNAKNESFQTELDKVQAIYKKVLEKSIQNLNSQVTVAQLLSTILKGVSDEPASLAAAQEQMNQLQVTFVECQTIQRSCDSNIKALQDRITDLTGQTTPSPLPETWWNQFN